VITTDMMHAPVLEIKVSLIQHSVKKFKKNHTTHNLMHHFINNKH